MTVAKSLPYWYVQRRFTGTVPFTPRSCGTMPQGTLGATFVYA